MKETHNIEQNNINESVEKRRGLDSPRMCVPVKISSLLRSGLGFLVMIMLCISIVRSSYNGFFIDKDISVFRSIISAIFLLLFLAISVYLLDIFIALGRAYINRLSEIELTPEGIYERRNRFFIKWIDIEILSYCEVKDNLVEISVKLKHDIDYTTQVSWKNRMWFKYVENRIVLMGNYHVKVDVLEQFYETMLDLRKKALEQEESVRKNGMEQVLNHLGIRGLFRDLILGNREILDNYSGFIKLDYYWYGYPPAFIPVFGGEYSEYYGFVKHFFMEREVTFVDYHLETGYFYECLRNEGQLMSKLVIEAIMIEDDLTEDDLTDEIIEYCKNVGFTQYDEVNAFSIEYGDDSKMFYKLVNFDTETPLEYVKDLKTYRGEFPSNYELLNEKQLHNSCSYEIARPELLEGIADIPKWLQADVDMFALFNQYVEEDKLKEAWLTLNSKDMKYKDVKTGLLILKQKTNDEFFHLVADRWIEGYDGSYYGKLNRL